MRPSVLVAITAFTFFSLGCDMLGPDNTKVEKPEKPNVDLGVRSLEQIADSQDISFETGPPVTFEGGSANTDEFRLDGVLQSTEHMKTTRFLLQFETSEKRTPRFLMEVNQGEKYETASVDYFVRWQETKASLTKSYESSKQTIDVSSITSPGDTLKVSAMYVYPDTVLSVKTVYEYPLSKTKSVSAHKVYTVSRSGETIRVIKNNK